MERKPSPRAAAGRIGVSATNAHLVVEGYEAPNAAGRPAHLVSPEGAPIAVAVSVPEPALHLEPAQDAHNPRAARMLPLSGKSIGAPRELAERYLDWLGERNGAAASGESAAEPVIADMAWTAGLGRSHFAHRAGIVFHDAASLEAGLRCVARAGRGSEAGEATGTACAYAGEDGPPAAAVETLYRSEPVVRALIDRCDAILREKRTASLLDEQFGRTGPDRTLGDPATFALQCGLTALWSSVGVSPGVVVGLGAGELAVAHAAGMLGLEEGLRLAMARDSLVERSFAFAGAARADCAREIPEPVRRTSPASPVGAGGWSRAGNRNPPSAGGSCRTSAGRCSEAWGRNR